MKKKVDSRVRILVENAAALRQRAFFVIVGDRGRDQVVNLHYMLSKITTRKPSVLWCYKKELGFSSHRKKRMKQLKKKIQRGLFDPNIDDPFELFVSSTRIRYCYYKETDSILGQTFGMCILQDFEALTPNILCRALETVEGGGVVCILLQTMTSLRQLYKMTMDAHRQLLPSSRLSSTDIISEPRFNERFILSLSDCANCLIVDDELNILPLSRRAKDIVPLPSSSVSGNLKECQKPIDPCRFEVLGDSGDPELLNVKRSLTGVIPAGPLVNLAVTLAQAKVLMAIIDQIMEKSLSTTISLTAGRGRGKSATLGLALVSAVAHGYSNIFITAPSPENIGTVFEFVHKGLVVLGYKEHADFELIEGEVVQPVEGSESANKGKHIVRINVFRDHRQTIQYITPTDVSFARQSEILVIDEAAAIPLPLVSKLLGPYLVIVSSTVQGYEGTGRALSLKLLRDLKQRSVSQSSAGGAFKEMELTEPIRYALGDPVESWLNSLLCLDATIPEPLTTSLALPGQCQLYHVNREALFSYHRASERFLHKLMSLFVSSHYKNSPNDLLLLSDAPSHHIFVLLPPLTEDITDIPDVFVAIQVAIEGSISKDAIKQALGRGTRPAGDLLPWTLSQHFIDEDFGQLNAVRIVRIATHPAIQRLGYGTEALRQLCVFYEQQQLNLTLLDRSIKQTVLEKLKVGDLSLPNEHEVNTSTPSTVGTRCKEEVTEVETLQEPESNSLRTEILKARDAPPLLIACADSKPPVTVHYIGTAFGLSVDLFKFYSRLNFFPVYLRQTVNDITGEHSVIMLRCLSGEQWLIGFVDDFKNRITSLLGSVFRHLPVDVALSLVAPAELVKSSLQSSTSFQLSELSHSSVRYFFSSHDLLRLERFSQQLTERTMILDLIPTLASLFFTNRLKGAGLSYTQSAVLLAIGLQRKTINDTAKELSISTSQVNALFNKAIFKLYNVLHRMQETEVAEELQKHYVTGREAVSEKLELPNDLPSKNFEEELNADARLESKELERKRNALLSSLEQQTALAKYALEGLKDEEIEVAVHGREKLGSVSIKTKRHSSQNKSSAENPGFSLKKRHK